MSLPALFDSYGQNYRTRDFATPPTRLRFWKTTSRYGYLPKGTTAPGSNCGILHTPRVSLDALANQTFELLQHMAYAVNELILASEVGSGSPQTIPWKHSS